LQCRKGGAVLGIQRRSIKRGKQQTAENESDEDWMTNTEWGRKKESSERAGVKKGKKGHGSATQRTGPESSRGKEGAGVFKRGKEEKTAL